jgi:transaldolase
MKTAIFFVRDCIFQENAGGNEDPYICLHFCFLFICFLLMKIFLDTADIELIKTYASWGIVDGVITNPTLIAKEGVDPVQRIKEITQIVDGPISVEVVAEKADEMVKQAHHVTAWHKNIYAKIPMTSEGLKAVKILSQEGIKTNVTLVFSVSQAVMAAKAGATLVSPFMGRVDDISYDGADLIAQIVAAFHTYGFETQVLGASLRHAKHFVECLEAGADIVTLPPKLMEKLVAHPLTDQGLAGFMKDWDNCEACKNLYK